MAEQFGAFSQKPRRFTTEHGKGSTRAAIASMRQLVSHGWISKGLGKPMTLAPWTRRQRFEHFPNVPEGIAPGWVQIPGERTFAIGFFLQNQQFMQLALADDRGRVYATEETHPDLHDAQAQFFLFKEGEGTIVDGRRLGYGTHHNNQPIKVIHGGVVGVGADGNTMWLASWLKTGNRYTLEQLRADLPERMLHDLEYRDAITIAFFAAYLLPKMQGLLLGFGSGNIFRRLNRQAPLSAIRSSVRDAAEAHAHGLRVSGLEDYAAMLMREAGALDDIPGLQADHGAEPMHLITSELSNTYFLTWDTSLPFDAALTSLKIEGNLNRFAQVSSWLEMNGNLGLEPIEDTVSQAQAALIDQALLRNPSLLAFPNKQPINLLQDQAFDDVNRLVNIATETAQGIALAHPNPVAQSDISYDGSDWHIRQSLANLLRRLRLPYRFDTDFRASIASGRLALSFTTAGPALMPISKYDAHEHDWITLTDAQRAHMSAEYNLRVGIMLAALAFGVNPNIQEVTLCIDSIGLEEAIQKQDNAIKTMMSDVLSAVEQWRDQDLDFSDGGKSDPKDSNQHPTTMRITSEESTGTEGISAHSDDEFEQLMRGGGIDEMTFRLDEEEQSQHNEEQQGDPLEKLRSIPTLTRLVTVTFTRDEFLQRLAADGLEHPQQTFSMFDASMNMDDQHGLMPTESSVSIHDACFTSEEAQRAPEAQLEQLPAAVGKTMGATDSFGLAIQREDILAHAVERFHELAAQTDMASVDKAQEAMKLIERINDPELTSVAPQITTALIDGEDTPDIEFIASSQLDEARLKARDLLFSGQIDQAVAQIESVVNQLDEQFNTVDGVPRYFNSYADRVIYNQMFAIPGERTVLIPDNLFYAHMELADALGQIKGAQAALPHLNKLVAYAPSYALSHLKLAIQLAREEDWDSAKAACLNALRVSLDRGDAAFAYYRLGQAAWMRDEFDVAVASYMMSDLIAPSQLPTLREELAEVRGRARSQCIAVPETIAAAQNTLIEHDIPVWPATETAPLMLRAARVCVDQGMFVPARTLAVAAARMADGGIDAVQLQFLRTLHI